MIKILFICHGNICRSPMAEFIFKKLIKDKNLENEFYVSSVATSREELGNDMYPPAQNVLDKHGIYHSHRQARQITKEDILSNDYLIAMDQNNVRNLNRMFPDIDLSKVSLLMSYANDNNDVSDPWYTGNFEKAYQDIYKGCVGLLENIID